MIKDVEQYTFFTKKERAERFGVCQQAIWQALKKMGLTYKKRYVIRKPTKALGKRFNKKQQYEESKTIVFIDESGFSHDTPRTHGYYPKG